MGQFHFMKPTSTSTSSAIRVSAILPLERMGKQVGVGGLEMRCLHDFPFYISTETGYHVNCKGKYGILDARNSLFHPQFVSSAVSDIFPQFVPVVRVVQFEMSLSIETEPVLLFHLN
uniref:Uncharacterized protein n=1 Tax=Cacopsylla melanoneura TaxID=428564 RepID=A0A8D8W5P1_9HEMI